MRGWTRTACLLLFPSTPQPPCPRHLLPLGDMLGQAAGILCILIMAWPASCHCHLPLTLPACSPGKKHPTQGARCLSPIAGMTSLPASSFLHGFAMLVLMALLGLCPTVLSPAPQPLGIPLSPGLWVFVSFSKPLTSVSGLARYNVFMVLSLFGLCPCQASSLASSVLAPN